MGFIKLQDEAYVAHEKWEEDTRPKKTFSKILMRRIKGIAGDELNPDRLEFNYPLKYDDKDKNPITVKNIIVPKDHHHRFEFAYRAGHWYGYRPKPDTHIVSCTVEYQVVEYQVPKSSGKVLQAHTDMEIVVYPSLTGMLFGALVGSFFGTIAQNMMAKTPLDALTLIKTGLLLNLILAFIGAVILIRRKNVESFITIEDFWGGILIGFVVGYSGFAAFQKLAGLLPH
jgi:hypothetical protein